MRHWRGNCVSSGLTQTAICLCSATHQKNLRILHVVTSLSAELNRDLQRNRTLQSDANCQEPPHDLWFD